MEETYKKSKGNAGLEGVQFQLDLLIVCLLNALHSRKGWKISTENQEAGKYDDIVVELANESAVLIQAKHKDNKKITKDLLLSHNSKNADFSLPKYFFSYEEIKGKYKEKTVIICSNTIIDKKGLHNLSTSQSVSADSMLNEGGSCSFFTFNEQILPELKSNAELYFDKNLQGKGIDKSAITDDNLKEFLKDLQVFTNYPTGEELHKIIEYMLSRLSGSSLWSKTSYHDLYRKVEEWFKQPKGEYLTEYRAKAIFCEVKSERYCQLLKNYKVSFQRNDFSFTDSKSIFHVTTNGEHLLQMLKIYSALQGDKSKKLYVNPNDSTEVQKHVIEAFQLRRYAFLIITWNRIKEKNVTKEIIDLLKELLKKIQYKKVILVAEDDNELTHQIGLEHVSKLDGNIAFADLSENDQHKLLNNKNVVFQGEQITLEELIVTQANEDYTKSLYLGMLETLVKMEEVKVGEQPLQMDEETARYYINRTFEKGMNEAGTSGEIFPEESFYDVMDKVTVIADNAGMGKSTILTRLAVTLKMTHRHLWVIRINLNDYTKVLRDTLKKERDTISVTELLNSKRATKLANEFEKFVFLMKEKVVLMLDAVDEISPDYTHLILDLIAQCEVSPNFAKILVTTRPHMIPDLEAAFNVRLFKLKPFLKEDQIHFLTGYWTHNLQLRSTKDNESCEQYAKLLMEKMSLWVDDDYFFAEIPLHVRMLAEVFQDNVAWKESTDWEGCKQYLSGDKAVPILPQKFNLAKLYDMFIEKKRVVFVDKGNPSGNVIANFAINTQFDQCMAYHRTLALTKVFDETKKNLFSDCYCTNKAMDIYMLQIGIVQRSEDEFQFVHRTFVEYFVTSSFLEELQHHNTNIELLRLLIDKIFLYKEFRVIRTFFNNRLQDGAQLSLDSFETYRSTCGRSSSSCDISSENILLVFADEGCVEILQLILKCLNFKIIRSKNINLNDLEELRLRVNEENMISNTLSDLKILVEEAGINISGNSNRSLLYYAVQGGHLRMVQFLIEQGADITIKDSDSGGTALHVASYNGHVDIIKYLVDLGCDINVRNVDGETAVHSAVLWNHTDAIKYLVGIGVDIDAKDRKGRAALHLNIRWGKELNVIKYLVELGADVNVKDNDGQTALGLAAQMGHLDAVKYLVELGADINSKDNYGRKPLALGASKGYLEIVKYFVQIGGDISDRDNEGNTPLLLAGNIDTVKYLVTIGADLNNKNNNGETILYTAAFNGDVDIIQYAVEMTGNTNVENNKGDTPLHFAMLLDQFKVIQYFVEQGVDINTINHKGQTILHWSSRISLNSLKRYVEEFGANVNIRDNEGYTILHCAVEKGRFDFIPYIVEVGGNINTTNNASETALHLACSYGNLDTVRCLKELGADATSKDMKGYTTIHVSVVNRKLNIIEYLVGHGVPVEIRDSRGRTAMHLAAEIGDLDIIERLVELGADMSITDDDGYTPLHWAFTTDKFNVVKYLIEMGVDVNSRDNDGRTVAHLFASKGTSRDIRNVHSLRCYLTALASAIFCIYYIARHGLDVNIRDHLQRTALHLASKNGIQFVKFFIEHGADVGCKDSEGRTALHLAAAEGKMDNVKYIVELGTLDINTVDTDGQTALHLASTNGHSDIVNYLKDNGADVNCRDNNGKTAQGLAAENNHN